MKFYDEARMGEVRERLEGDVMKWPGVARKEMMGCLCYFRGRRFFAFLVNGGIVVTKLGVDDRSKLSSLVASRPFEMAGKTPSTWIQVSVAKPVDVKPILPYVRKSYEAAAGP